MLYTVLDTEPIYTKYPESVHIMSWVVQPPVFRVKTSTFSVNGLFYPMRFRGLQWMLLADTQFGQTTGG
jgi:hypothetical protein